MAQASNSLAPTAGIPPTVRHVSAQRKVHHVTTLRRVAVELGVDEEATWTASEGRKGSILKTV